MFVCLFFSKKIKGYWILGPPLQGLIVRITLNTYCIRCSIVIELSKPLFFEKCLQYTKDRLPDLLYIFKNTEFYVVVIFH